MPCPASAATTSQRLRLYPASATAQNPAATGHSTASVVGVTRSDHGKEHVERGDHDQDRWIERPVPIQSGHAGQEPD